MWKEFFYYTPREKRGIAVLIILIVLAIGAKRLLQPQIHPTLPETDEAFEQMRSEFANSLQEKPLYKQSGVANSPEEREIILQIFDPNTADSLTFLQLGLSARATANLLKYRFKGGKFRTPEAFSKIYGVTEEQYTLLRPYIRIAETFQAPPVKSKEKEKSHTIYQTNRDSVSFEKIVKYPAGVTVNLNQSDTTELKKIPGIGSTTAHRIINYRNRLGGFHNVDQLSEIGLESEAFKEWLEVSETDIQRINLNQVSIERLRAHPYFNFYQAKAIIEYRKKKGKLKNLTVFELYEEFKEEDFARIKQYVCF